MLDRDEIDRRRVLEALGAVGAGSVLAGCTGDGGDGGDGDSGGDGGSGGGTATQMETTAGGDTMGGGSGESYFGVEGPFADAITGTAWDGWDVPSVAGEFEARTEASVDVSYIGSDVKGFNQVKGGADLQFIIPDNVWVSRLGEADLAQPIDEELFSEELSNIPDWIKSHRTMFHDDTRYGIPPRWGVMGTVYNKEKISQEQAREWATFWNTDFEDRTIIFDVPLFTVPNIVLYLERKGELSLGLEDMSRDERTDAVYGAVQDHYDTIKQATIDMMDNAKLLAGTTAQANRPLLNGTADAFNGFLLNYAQLKVLEESLGQDKIAFEPTPGLGGVFWIEGFTVLNGADSPELTNTANAFGKWVLSPRGQANVAWTENRKSAPCNYATLDLLSDRKKELLFLDRGEEIFNNSVDYIPTNTDRWLQLWEEAKQA